MIPSGVEIYLALEPIDMRFYAEHIVMRSCVARRAARPERTVPTTPHNHGPVRDGRSAASNLSGARKRPRRRAGGSTESIASSFAVGSART